MIKLSAINELIIVFLGFKYLHRSYYLRKNIDILFLFNSSITLYYGIIPFLYKMTNYTYKSGYMNSIENIESFNLFFTSFMHLLVYLSFYFITNPKRIRVFHHSLDVKVRKTSLKLIKNLAYITLLVGSISFLVIAKQVGGILKLIELGDVLRSYGQDLSSYISPSLLPLRLTMTLILVSPFLFYVIKAEEKKVIYTFLFFISFFFSILFLLFNAGRAPMLLFLLPFIMNYLTRKNAISTFKLILVGLIVLLLVYFLDDLFFFISYGSLPNKPEEINKLSYFIEQLGYPYANSVNRHRLVESIGLRGGRDYFTWIINIVPVSILRKFGLQKIQNMNDLLSMYYSGTSSISGLTGGIPIDIITFGYTQLGFFGSILSMVIISILLKKLTKFQYSDLYINKTRILYLRIGFSTIFWVPNALPDAIFRGGMDIIFLIVLIFSINIQQGGLVE